MSKWTVICENIGVFLKNKKARCAEKIKCLWDKLVRNVPVDKNITYTDFTPEKELENGQEYIRALHWALKNDDVKNIALTGPYGSGKSSVIRSYLQHHPSTRAINISLATFNWEKKDYKEFKDEVEIGILKQLFYKIDSKKIPQSRYRKLRKVDLRNYFFTCIFMLGMSLVVLGFFFPANMQTVLEWIANCGRAYNLSERITFSFLGVILTMAMLIIAIVCKWVTTRFQIKEINIADKATVSGEQDEASVFDKNMDEIVYFFEETLYDTVFIEDLDRFDSSEIFIKLRELNAILNNYDLIKRRIVFVYAIKDDMFKNEERTKFFDFIIPVIPITNSTNSGEKLREKLKFKTDEKGVYKSTIYNISNSYVTLISPFIKDMRVLTSICNEFAVYKNTLKSLRLNDEKMFSLMIFKNLFPTEFAELEQDEGIVKEAFSDKKKFIAKKIGELKEINEQKKHILENVDQDVLKDIRELKAAFLNHLTGNEGMFSYCNIKGNSYDFLTIMKDDFDLSIFNNKVQATIYYFYNTSGSRNSRTINNLREEIQNNCLLERWESLQYAEEERKEALRKEIENNEEKIMNLRSYSIMTLLDKYGTENILSENVRANKILVFMLKRGFINENYADYINYFHPNSITEGEMNYIRGIRMEEPVGDFTYPIKNVERVCEKIEDYEFKQVEALNYDVADYLFTERLTDNKCKNFFVGLTRGTDKELEFINCYVERNKNCEIFIKTLCSYYPGFWCDISNNNVFTEDSKFKYVALILSYAEETDIVKINNFSEYGNIKDFIEQNEYALGKISEVPANKLCNIIDLLDLYFVNINIDNVDSGVLEHIFSKKKYELNVEMICRFCEYKFPEKVQALKTANYTTLCEIAYGPVMEYVHDNFANYVTEFILEQENNTCEDVNAVEDILERLYVEAPDICKCVLDKQTVRWEVIEDCCRTGDVAEGLAERQVIWNHVLKNRMVKAVWANFISYYKCYGMTDGLLTWLDEEIDMLIQDNNIPSKIVEEIIISDISLDAFTKIIQTYKIEEFENGLKDFTPEQTGIMIRQKCIPFKPELLDEVQDKASEFATEYIQNNRIEFVDDLENCNLTVDVVTSLIRNNEYNDSQKLIILQKITEDEVNLSLAMAIRELEFTVPKEYVEVAWGILDEENRYQLLLNHLNVYTLDEISEKLSLLAPEYQKFADRTKKHKEYLNADELGYNESLLNKLFIKDYLTSVEEEEYDIYNMRTRQKEKQKRFVAWVKKASE